MTGFRAALTRTINNYARSSGLFKKDDEKLAPEDVREGLVAVISVKLPQPQFEGQTKGKLNSDVKGQVEALSMRVLDTTSKRTPPSRKIIAKPSTPPLRGRPQNRDLTAQGGSIRRRYRASLPVLERPRTVEIFLVEEFTEAH
jgi:DNA gyrase subunit B